MHEQTPRHENYGNIDLEQADVTLVEQLDEALTYVSAEARPLDDGHDNGDFQALHRQAFLYDPQSGRLTQVNQVMAETGSTYTVTDRTPDQGMDWQYADGVGVQRELDAATARRHGEEEPVRSVTDLAESVHRSIPVPQPAFEAFAQRGQLESRQRKAAVDAFEKAVQQSAKDIGYHESTQVVDRTIKGERVDNDDHKRRVRLVRAIGASVAAVAAAGGLFVGGLKAGGEFQGNERGDTIAAPEQPGVNRKLDPESALRQAYDDQARVSDVMQNGRVIQHTDPETGKQHDMVIMTAVAQTGRAQDKAVQQAVQYGKPLVVALHDKDNQADDQPLAEDARMEEPSTDALRVVGISLPNSNDGQSSVEHSNIQLAVDVTELKALEAAGRMPAFAVYATAQSNGLQLDHRIARLTLVPTDNPERPVMVAVQRPVDSPANPVDRISGFQD